MGIPPTNRHAETHGCTVAEIKNGKAVRTWGYWDTGHLLRQLGVMRA
jgi:predicted ester cyclase